MKLGIPAGVDSPLGKRLAGLTLLRLVVLSAFLGIIELYYNRQLDFGGFSSLVAMVTVGIAFLFSALYALLLRVGRQLERIAYAQLATDQLTWTAVVYLSGGVTSGSTSLYGLTCLSGAILLGSSGAVFAAVCAVVAYLTLCIGFATGALPPPVDQPIDAYVTDTTSMVYPAASTLLATMLVTALATYLAERLRSASGRLRDATARAERAERLAMLGRLAAALAHEIRNPLGSIRGSIELLRTGGSLSHEDTRLCEIIEREAIRLNDLVTDMVDLSRPRAPAIMDIDLAVTAKSVVELAQRSGRGDDVRIGYEGPDSLTVRADAGQMRQVLWNLVRNAVQASGPGSDVVVQLERRESGDVVMSVCDHGSGIPESKRDHIFDAFYTTRSHGVGIGLAVVRQVLDAHGFAVNVDSKQDEGTTVEVRIPRTSVLAALVLVVAGCGGGDWIRSPLESPGEGDGAWLAEPPPAASSPALAPRSPAAASSEPAPSAAAATSEPVSIEGSVETYRNTYYDFPSEQPHAPGSPTRQLFDPECRPLATVSQDFYDQVCVQGSGRVLSGYTVSFARRDCECASECPRTGQRICFERLDRQRFPFGRGATGKAITPLRTVAVDDSLVPLGTVLYIPDYQGLRAPDGKPHDGCFVAQDRGLKVKGKHVDIFTGDPETTKSWNAAVPSNKGVKVIIGAPQCRHLAAAAPRPR